MTDDVSSYLDILFSEVPVLYIYSILFSDVNTIIHLLRLVLCYVLNYCYLSSSYFKSQGGGPNRKKLRTLRAAIYEREK